MCDKRTRVEQPCGYCMVVKYTSQQEVDLECIFKCVQNIKNGCLNVHVNRILSHDQFVCKETETTGHSVQLLRESILNLMDWNDANNIKSNGVGVI